MQLEAVRYEKRAHLATVVADDGGEWQAQDGAPAVPPSGFGGLTARYDFPRPVVAAPNGLALACDVVVAAEHAMLGLSEPLGAAAERWAGR